MNSLIKIRSAKNHDAKKIYELLCEKEDFLFDIATFEINYRICIGDARNIYMVAVDKSNVVVGFISCHGQIVLHHGGVIYEVKELFIEKKYGINGIGKMLLREMQTELSKKEYRSLEASVDNQKNDLIQLYKNAGFDQKQIKLISSKIKDGKNKILSQV
ncbi:MAG TPA: GNAT family N-acetyltransferase [Puia sp.]|jgi:PhnO protein|nr:GNAT family N-acetyltransferase [Puia sp.]